MIVAMRDVCAEYGHRTVKQTYENILKQLMAYGLRCPYLIQPSELWRILARVRAGTLIITLFKLINKFTVIVATTILLLAPK
jgi:hypothetical protein